MSYTIVSSAVVADTLNTVVTYTLSDSSQQTVTVSHFQPASEAVVLQNIVNREATLNQAISATATNNSIASTINAAILASGVIGM